jgi:hypothetical protein
MGDLFSGRAQQRRVEDQLLCDVDQAPESRRTRRQHELVVRENLETNKQWKSTFCIVFIKEY